MKHQHKQMLTEEEINDLYEYSDDEDEAIFPFEHSSNEDNQNPNNKL
jgi:hypothetical protein